MDFLHEFLPYIVSGVVAIVNIILFLCKKNKVVLEDTIYEYVLELLPELIHNAESFIKEGSEKKVNVLSYAMAQISRLSGMSLERCRELYQDRLSKAIESILSTPEKKGVIYEK